MSFFVFVASEVSTTLSNWMNKACVTAGFSLPIILLVLHRPYL